MNQMTLRSAPDGWHYGIEVDDDEVDSAAGRLEGDTTAVVAGALALIAEYSVKVVDIREDVPHQAAAALAGAMGRKLRSAPVPAPLAVQES